MDAQQAKALRAAFPPEAIGHKPKGGVEIDFVGHAATTDRLLSVDPEWTWEPFAVSEYGLPVFDNAGGLWIKLTVCGVTRLGYGDGPNPKEVIGDAIRNAAMRFGVALDLWAKEDLSNIAVATPPGDNDPGESTVADKGPVTRPTEPSDAQAAQDAASPEPVTAVAGLAAAATAVASSGAAPAEGTAPDPTSEASTSPPVSGGSGSVTGDRPDEEGAEPDGVTPEGASDGSAYLTKPQVTELIKLFGSSKELVAKANEMLGGENIRRGVDLTVDQARELVERKRQAAA